MSEIHYDACDGGLPLVQERAAVRKGAALLDKILPGWHNEVELDRLEMANGSMCMMGQLFGTAIETDLAKKMYPGELEEAATKYEYDGEYDGFDVAGTWRAIDTSLIGRLMAKIGLNTKSKASLAKFKALQHVCSGHDNSCLWAEQITERKAKEAEGGKH